MGAVCGAINGLFGSGGGMIAVPMLEHDGVDTKKAHASSLALTLPLSIVSAFVYLQRGSFDLGLALKFIPWGLAGAAVGTLLMKHITDGTLQKLFGAVMIYFGVRMILR